MVEQAKVKGTETSGITDATNNETQMVRRQVENLNRKISDYHLLRVIGTGTFGKVYLALLNGQPVALKALKKTQIITLR